MTIKFSVYILVVW